ncbi:hypothetical protein HYV86_06230 [Candidatus Woesearchaeota archaeon]|nr:hypothetical protein [Candidatus Woesearchaeota archaeon]
MKSTHTWNITLNHAFSLPVERYFVGFLSLLVFCLSLLQFGRLFDAILLTALFLAIYTLIYTIVLEIRKLEKTYTLTNEALQILHKSRRKSQRVKIPLNAVIKHKFDHVLLGGYLMTTQGVKHLLFFNSKEDARHVEHRLGQQKKKR